MKLIIILSLVSTCIWAQNCKYTISAPNFVGQVKVSEQIVSHSFTIRTGKKNNNCKNFRAFYGKGNANSYNRKVYNGNKTINYNIYQDSGMNNILKEFGDASSGEYIQGNLPNKNTDYPFDAFYKIIDLDSVFSNGPGYYNDLIPISFYSIKSNGTLVYQKTAYMNMQLIIPRYAEISLGPVGSSHDRTRTQYIMNFGTIQDNESLDASLIVKGNVGFGIYMTSQNGGKLTNGSSFIPYTVSVGNSGTKSLNNAGQQYYMTQQNNATNQSGDVFPVNVTLGNLSSNASTGNYDEVITITVNAW